MEESASLTMLKKAGAAKAPDVTEELEKNVQTAAQTGDEVTVDVDTMNSAQLDALVKENEIETPI